ncbi:MAG TPA: YetF domain-containing protein [Acidimicrobiia bacterium]|jgi:uncharacterized membrane protein YcaP (DUF421 family)|nr:YetF domain-containing protein [Acidimicrobiia bacterium]
MGVVLRSAVAFLFIFLLLKLVGKKELSELSPFELILLVVIGDIVQQGITQEDFSLVGAILAAGTLALLTVLFSYMSFKFDPARRLLEGLPVVILRDGELLPEALKLERLQPHEVDQAARKQGLDDLSSVELAVLEPDGTISFLSPSSGNPGETKHKM